MRTTVMLPDEPFVLRPLEQTGGPHPGIDLTNNAQLLDIMDGLIEPGQTDDER